MIELINRILYGIRHDFDLDNPSINHIDVENGDEIDTYIMFTYRCKNCEKTLTLDYNEMLNLPKQMLYGCK